MANIHLDNPNFSYIDNFFYTLDESNQLLLKVTFDGSLAYCYTLDVPLSYEVNSLAYDGYGFWSLERGSSRIIIRRWVINDLICVQKDRFEFVSTSSEIIDSYAFAVESYITNFSGDEPSGQTILSISDGTHMSNGDKLLLGPNTNGDIEEVTVQSASSSSVTLTSSTVNGYNAGSKIRYYKYGYFFNNYDGTDSSKGSLYKIDLYTGSVIRRESGTQFKDVKSCSVGTVADRNGNGVIDYDGNGINDVFDALLFVKGSLLFMTDMYTTTFRLISNMLLDISTGSTIYDMTSRGSVLYLLQSGYDYTVAQFDIMVRSVSVSSYPTIVPADGISTSLITATVLDQYNNPIVSKIVEFSVTLGSLSASSGITDANGVATVTFISSTTVGTSTITASVTQN